MTYQGINIDYIGFIKNSRLFKKQKHGRQKTKAGASKDKSTAVLFHKQRNPAGLITKEFF